MKKWTADDILAFRAKYNLTQDEMGKLLGITAFAISCWELNKRSPNRINLFKLNQLEKKEAPKK